MGAESFYTKSWGKNMSEAYSNAVSEAIHEYGNDVYNGTISTTNSFRDVTAEFKRSGLSLKEFINVQHEKLNKRDCVGVCVNQPKVNTNKVKTKVINHVYKGARKWETIYTATTKWGNKFIGESQFKDEAVKKARAYTEKTQEETVVSLSKRLVKSDSKVATIEYKKAKEECNGEYVFIGWGAS